MSPNSVMLKLGGYIKMPELLSNQDVPFPLQFNTPRLEIFSSGTDKHRWLDRFHLIWLPMQRSSALLPSSKGTHASQSTRFIQKQSNSGLN